MATPCAPAGLRQLPQTLQCGAASLRTHGRWGGVPAAGRYVETHEFYFDEVFDERVRNEEVLPPPAGRRPPAPPRPAPPWRGRGRKGLKTNDRSGLGGIRRELNKRERAVPRAVQVYRRTAQPLVGSIFNGGKATCFAYAVAAASIPRGLGCSPLPRLHRD